MKYLKKIAKICSSKNRHQIYKWKEKWHRIITRIFRLGTFGFLFTKVLTREGVSRSTSPHFGPDLDGNVRRMPPPPKKSKCNRLIKRNKNGLEKENACLEPGKKRFSSDC